MNDVVDVARYGVGDVPVLRVTTAFAVFLVDVVNFQVCVPFDDSMIMFIYAFREHLISYIQLLHTLLHPVAPALELAHLNGTPCGGGQGQGCKGANTGPLALG